MNSSLNAFRLETWCFVAEGEDASSWSTHSRSGPFPGRGFHRHLPARAPSTSSRRCLALGFGEADPGHPGQPNGRSAPRRTHRILTLMQDASAERRRWDRRQVLGSRPRIIQLPNMRAGRAITRPAPFVARRSCGYGPLAPERKAAQTQRPISGKTRCRSPPPVKLRAGFFPEML